MLMVIVLFAVDAPERLVVKIGNDCFSLLPLKVMVRDAVAPVSTQVASTVKTAFVVPSPPSE